MAKSRGLFAVLTVLPVVVLAAAPAAAQTVADFYRGKTLTMVVGTSPGGDYDLRLRMVARHIGRHIPGNPTVVVNNMPGGGGLVVANWLANVAPKDGSVAVAITQNLPVHQATGAQGVKFDVREFNWIGNTTDTPNVINSWHTTGIRTIQDVMQRELVVGATGIASGSYLYPHALNQLAGTKFKIVTGYASLGAVDIAMERGEVQGKVGSTWKSLNSGPSAHWVKDGIVSVIVQLGVKKSPDIPADVPLALDLATSPEDRQVLEVLCAPSATGYPSFMGPGVPRERVAAVRTAYAAAMMDPEFIDAVIKGGLDIDPIGADELTEVVRGIYALPEAAVARARELLPAQ